MSIINDRQAEWALGKISTAKKELARLEELAKVQIDEINQRLEAARTRQANEIHRMEELLLEYFNSVPHHKTKTQETYRLLSGVLRLKTSRPTAKRDDDQLTTWLADRGMFNFLKIKPSVKWADLSKKVDLSTGQPVFVDTGEIIEGVEVIPPSTTFSVEVTD